MDDTPVQLSGDAVITDEKLTDEPDQGCRCSPRGHNVAKTRSGFAWLTPSESSRESTGS
jgi:hypothetical protein